MGWLSGWQYRKSHQIVGSSAGAQTDYQIRVRVYYGSGTDSGENVYLGGKCRTDFGDVRFTASDGETPLSYWMESKVDSNYAVFWVKVPSIPASPNSATIYIYYGKSDAATTSNGSNTFLLFDDFANTNGWTRTQITAYGSGTDGTLELETDGGATVVSQTVTSSYANKHEGLRSNSQVQSLYKAIETRARIVSPTGTGVLNDAHIGFAFLWSDVNNWVMMTYYSRDAKWDLWKCVGGTVTHVATVTEAISNIFRRWTLVNYENTYKIIIDGIEKVSGTITDFSQANRYVGIYDYAYTATAHFHVDWIAVRKYVSPEPSHGAWGSEETGLILIQWSQTGFVSHVYKHPRRSMKMAQSLNIFHIFLRPFRSFELTHALSLTHALVRHRLLRLSQTLWTLHTWAVTYPSLILKKWTASLNLTHALRRPFRRLGYLQMLQPTHTYRRPTRIIRLQARVQAIHSYGVPLHFIKFLERLGLAHIVYVAVPGVKKTRLFLVIGDLAIQITGD